MIPHGRNAPSDRAFLNNAGETVPPFGLMFPNDVDSFSKGIVVKIKKPDASTCKPVCLINGPIETADGKRGRWQTGPVILFAYDTGTPAKGDTYGAKSGQWTATKDSTGFIEVYGIEDATNKIAVGRIRSIAGGPLLWARVQTGFVNVKATSKTNVSVKSCDSDDTDGHSETGDAFNAIAPIRKNKATALFTGYIVGYLIDSAGDKFIVTDCFDDMLGTVKQWDGATADVPDGWAECDGTGASEGHLARPDARGKYIAGVDGSHALDATGGALTHTHTDHVHSEHSGSAPWNVGRTACVWFDDHTHNAVNHEPPWLGLYNIKRTN